MGNLQFLRKYHYWYGSSHVASWAVSIKSGIFSISINEEGVWKPGEKKLIFENLKILASSVSCCLAACIWLLKVDCSKSTGLVWNFAWFTWNNIQEVLSKESVLNNRKFCGKCSQRVLRCFRGMKEVVSNWRSWVYLIMYKWGGGCHHQPLLTIKPHSWSP